jgi:hypothetical protein
MGTTASQWIEAFCAEVGIEAPAEAETAQILRLAGIAAHASERVAAPVACWVAGVSGKPLEGLIETAERLDVPD